MAVEPGRSKLRKAVQHEEFLAFCKRFSREYRDGPQPFAEGTAIGVKLADSIYSLPYRNRIDGQSPDVDTLDGPDLAAWRSETIGFVFQGFNLIPVLSAVENVELPLLLTPLSRKERRAHAERALEVVGLADRRKHRPGQLSGGQEQRVAIARAVVTAPRLLLADEPTGDLDRGSADAVLDLLAKLNEELGKTILMVTHDPAAADHAKRVVNLDKGRLATAGA